MVAGAKSNEWLPRFPFQIILENHLAGKEQKMALKREQRKKNLGKRLSSHPGKNLIKVQTDIWRNGDIIGKCLPRNFCILSQEVPGISSMAYFGIKGLYISL